MPRVYLTETQRREAKMQRDCEKMYRSISDGLAILRNREELTKAQLAESLGIGYKSLCKLLKMESCALDIRILIKAIYMIGLEIKPRDQT